MNKILLDALRKHGPIAAIAIMLAGMLYWSMQSSAKERTELFQTQMEYIMDIRVAVEKCSR